MSQLPEISQPENEETKLPFIILALLGLGLIGYCIFGAITLFMPQQAETEVSAQTIATVIPAPSNAAQVLINESTQWTTVLSSRSLNGGT